MEFFFDVETSGFHKNGIEPTNPSQAWTVQLGFILSTKDRIYQEACLMFAPPHDNATIHPGAEKTHGISVSDCRLGGMLEIDAIDLISACVSLTDVIVCHNYNFDSKFMLDILERNDTQEIIKLFSSLPYCCTMLSSTDYCKLPGKWGKPKWPKLEQLYYHLFNCDFEGAHDALADVRATRRCYYELRERGVL